MKRLIALCICAVIFLSCKAQKHTSAKNAATTTDSERVPFKRDTTAYILELTPDKGYTLVIENIQVYVITREQPAVGFTIRPANGGPLHHLLPQYSNPESYSFGGGVHFELHPGDKGVIDIYDSKSKPLPSKIIVMGYQKK